MKPQRIQLSRKRGFRLQEASLALNGLPAVKVDRASGFGNPFKIEEGTETANGVKSPVWLVDAPQGVWIRRSEAEAREISVQAFKAWLMLPRNDNLRERAKLALRNKNLACWCSGSPCHADVLLEFTCAPAPSPASDR